MKKSTKRMNKTLNQLRAIALAISKCSEISVEYSDEISTACIDLENLNIMLTKNCLPDDIENYPTLYQYLLDGLCAHEAGHYVKTRPIESRYQLFENRQRFKRLAHHIVNIIEDKRVNHFIINRYRFDFGRRLALTLDVINKSMTKELEKKLPKSYHNVLLMMNILVHEGLYNGKGNSKLYAQLTDSQKADLKVCLSLLEKAKFTQIKSELIRISQEMYNLIAKYIDSHSDEGIGELIPNQAGGNLGIGSMDKASKAKAEKLEKEKEEKTKNKQNNRENDLSRSRGAGCSHGNNIPTPKPNQPKYFALVRRNAKRISELMDMLKTFVKPYTVKQIFQKRGRIMNKILAKAYVNSFRRNVSRIYIKNETHYEKQKISMGFLIDYSGSMNFSESQNSVTILNEVFGNWLDDESYAIIVFGGDYQKIKTFFEQFSNTRCRIGGISVNSSATNMAKCTSDMRKMFNSITDERLKLMVVCSDFYFGDRGETIRELHKCAKDGIRLIFVSFGNRTMFHDILPKVQDVYRTYVSDITELPKLFSETMANAIMGKK